METIWTTRYPDLENPRQSGRGSRRRAVMVQETKRIRWMFGKAQLQSELRASFSVMLPVSWNDSRHELDGL
jgi:hypothetical protein